MQTCPQPVLWHLCHFKVVRTYIKRFGQDFHFLLQDPRTLELSFKAREAQRIIDFDTFLKAF